MAQSYGHLKLLPLMRFWRLYSARASRPNKRRVWEKSINLTFSWHTPNLSSKLFETIVEMRLVKVALVWIEYSLCSGYRHSFDRANWAGLLHARACCDLEENVVIQRRKWTGLFLVHSTYTWYNPLHGEQWRKWRLGRIAGSGPWKAILPGRIAGSWPWKAILLAR
jgi:hypothetical protein